MAFEGEHDFRAVRSVGTETKTTVRTIYHCRVEKEGEMITVAICANGFLYNMCRAIVGTLVYASYGKLQPEEIPELLGMSDRILVMKDGRINGEFQRDPDLNEEALIAKMV